MLPELAELHRRLANLIRTGTVEEIRKGECRVKTGGITTDWRPYMTQRAGKARKHWRPSVGEPVVLLSPSGDLAGCYVFQSLFSDAYPVPTDEENSDYAIYDDGAVISYNPDTGQLKAIGVKSVVVEASNTATVKCPAIKLDGNVVVTGTFEAQQGGKLTGDFSHDGKLTNNGEISSNGVKLDKHKHPGVTSGTATTGLPA